MFVHLHHMLCHVCGPCSLLHACFYFHLHGRMCAFWLLNIPKRKGYLLAKSNLVTRIACMMKQETVVKLARNIIQCNMYRKETFESNKCWSSKLVFWRPAEVWLPLREENGGREIIVPLAELGLWGYFSSKEMRYWFELLWWFNNTDRGIITVLVIAPTWKINGVKQVTRFAEVREGWCNWIYNFKLKSYGRLWLPFWWLNRRMITWLLTSQRQTLQSLDADIKPDLLKLIAMIDPLPVPHQKSNNSKSINWIIENIQMKFQQRVCKLLTFFFFLK